MRVMRGIAFLFILLFPVLFVAADINEDLIEAAKNGETKIIESLLAQGAEVNAKNNLGWTPLMFATVNGYADSVRSLLQAGADLNVKDPLTGGTVLLLGVARGHSDVVRVLLEGGADPNLEIEDGSTALMAAAFMGNAEMAQTLLDAGADVNVENKEGKTAWMLATEMGQTDVVQLLEEAGAKRDPSIKPSVDPSVAKQLQAEHEARMRRGRQELDELATRIKASEELLALMRENQVSAQEAIRTLNTALFRYRETYKGFPASLSLLRPPSSGFQPSAQSADLVAAELAKGVSRGYVFTYRPGPRDAEGNVGTYTMLGRPTEYGASGRMSFYTNESGVIRYTDEDREATDGDIPL